MYWSVLIWIVICGCPDESALSLGEAPYSMLLVFVSSRCAHINTHAHTRALPGPYHSNSPEERVVYFSGQHCFYPFSFFSWRFTTFFSLSPWIFVLPQVASKAHLFVPFLFQPPGMRLLYMTVIFCVTLLTWPHSSCSVTVNTALVCEGRFC